MNLQKIARSFGLRAAQSGSATTFRRGNFTVSLREKLPVADTTDRNRAWCACLGVRLGIDRLTYAAEAGRASPAGEEQESRDIYQRHSPSGERIARLLPSAALSVAAAVADFDPFTRTWTAGVPFRLAFLLPHGRHLLALGSGDLLQTGTDAMADAALRVLFYEAYRLRPQSDDKVAHGRIRRFEARGGLGSSLGALLPDFDLDTARVRGAMMLPEYDRFISCRPSETARPSQLRETGREELRQATLPFSRRVYHLRPDGIIPGETCDATAEFDPSDLVLNLIEVSHD